MIKKKDNVIRVIKDHKDKLSPMITTTAQFWCEKKEEKSTLWRKKSTIFFHRKKKKEKRKYPMEKKSTIFFPQKEKKKKKESTLWKKNKSTFFFFFPTTEPQLTRNKSNTSRRLQKHKQVSGVPRFSDVSTLREEMKPIMRQEGAPRGRPKVELLYKKPSIWTLTTGSSRAIGNLASC